MKMGGRAGGVSCLTLSRLVDALLRCGASFFVAEGSRGEDGLIKVEGDGKLGEGEGEGEGDGDEEGERNRLIREREKACMVSKTSQILAVTREMMRRDDIRRTVAARKKGESLFEGIGRVMEREVKKRRFIVPFFSSLSSPSLS